MSEKSRPTLLLLPNLLGDHAHHAPFLPAGVDKAVARCDGLIAESEKGGRRYLSRFNLERNVNDIPLAILNGKTPDDEMDFLLEPVLQGECWGVVSDAGLPCIADPGACLVARAKQCGVVVQAFVGPSAVMMALMLSGMSGQQFAFQGYLPRGEEPRQEAIEKLEKKALFEQSTQIFIEVPYRNKYTLESLVNTLDERTRLCVAWDLTLPTQGVMSQEVRLWKKSPLPNLDKKAATFLISCEKKQGKAR